MNNIIDKSAWIHENVALGSYNQIGKNVVIDCKNPVAKINIGDNNIINDNTRIIVEGDLSVGDWNVFHNDMLILSGKGLEIGHNCWFGQNTILDGSGELEIRNGVRVGMYSQVWTHVASGELIEGCTLFGERKTIIDDNVWLVGSCIVSSGVIVGAKSVCLIGSNITKNTIPNKVYAGNPAKIMDRLNFYREISISEKFEMMVGWVVQFVHDNKGISFSKTKDEIKIWNTNGEQILIVSGSIPKNTKNKSIFSLESKYYIKTLSKLERNFYKYIYGNKARFIPVKF